MRKLGDAKLDESVVDSFRKLITEIGNTMGYVRMVRAGGVHTTGETIQCLPDTPDVDELPPPRNGSPPTDGADGADASVGGEYGPMSKLGEPCASAHDLASKVVAEMRSSFTDPGEYFAILEEVFAPEVRSAKNAHLANFYIMIPALTINFVDAMLQAKDRLHKKQREVTPDQPTSPPAHQPTRAPAHPPTRHTCPASAHAPIHTHATHAYPCPSTHMPLPMPQDTHASGPSRIGATAPRVTASLLWISDGHICPYVRYRPTLRMTASRWAWPTC